MNWYKLSQYDMYGQPLEFQDRSDNLMFDQTVSNESRSWYDNESNYRKGPTKDFYKEMRGLTGEIEWMSPDEYIERVVRGAYETEQPNTPYEQWKNFVIQHRRSSIIGDDNSKNLIEAYKDRWIAGEQPPMGYILYGEGGYIGQEGFHRALMAKDLGIIEIPVLILNRDE